MDVVVEVGEDLLGVNSLAKVVFLVQEHVWHTGQVHGGVSGLKNGFYPGPRGSTSFR